VAAATTTSPAEATGSVGAITGDAAAGTTAPGGATNLVDTVGAATSGTPPGIPEVGSAETDIVTVLTGPTSSGADAAAGATGIDATTPTVTTDAVAGSLSGAADTVIAGASPTGGQAVADLGVPVPAPPVGSAAGSVGDAVDAVVAPLPDAGGGVADLGGVLAPVGSAAGSVGDAVDAVVAPLPDAGGGVADLGGVLAPVGSAAGSATDALLGAPAPVADAAHGVVAPLPGTVGEPWAGLVAPVDSLAAPAADRANSVTASVIDALTATAPPGATHAIATPAGARSDAAATVAGSFTDVAGAHASATPQIGSAIPDLPGAVPAAASDPLVAASDVVGTQPLSASGTEGSGSIVDELDPFLIDPSVIGQALSATETRLIIGGLLSALLAGRAAGIGVIDFTQPVLQACTTSLRMTFDSVQLVRCEGQRAATRTAGRLSSSLSRQVRGSDVHLGHAGGSWNASKSASKRMSNGSVNWPIPVAATMLIRLVACLLASMSALVAGRAGVRHARREREQRRYGVRTH
jgi:hypothetical protein